MSNTTPHAALVDALQMYFDAFYTSDLRLLRTIFHPSARLYSYQDGVLQDEDLETYLARVAERPSPESLGQARMDEVILIDRADDGCAVAKTRAARLPRLYTDYVTLLNFDGQWRVMSKTFTWTLVE